MLHNAHQHYSNNENKKQNLNTFQMCRVGITQKINHKDRKRKKQRNVKSPYVSRQTGAMREQRKA